MADRTSDNLANIEDAQREQELAAKQAERATVKAAKEQDRAAEASRARDVRAAAAAGAKTVTDIETGKRSIATHPDGAPVFESGPITPVKPLGEVGQTLQDSQTGEKRDVPNMGIMLGGDSGALGATGTERQQVLGQQVRDDRGNVSVIPPKTETDPKTGMVTYDQKNETTGRTEKLPAGIDWQAREIAARKAQNAQDEQAAALEHNAANQARAAFEPQWQPVKAEYLKAKSELDGLPSPLVRRGSAWVHIDERTGKESMATPAEVEYQKKRREEAQARYDRAAAAHDPLAAQNEQITLAERSAKEKRLKVAEDRIRIEAGLPDDATETLTRTLAAQQAPDVTAPETEAAREVIGTPEPSANPAAPAPEKPLIPTDDPIRTKNFAAAFEGLRDPGQFTVGMTGEGHKMIQRNGANVGSIELSGGAPVVVLNAGANADLRGIAALGGTKGIPVYLADGTRQPIAKEAAWATQAFQTANQAMALPFGFNDMLKTPGTASPLADITGQLKDMGADYQSIVDKVKNGDISMQIGESLVKGIYGDTLQATDPLKPEAFTSFLDENPDQKTAWQAAANDKPAQSAIVSGFVSDWYAKNQHKPGVTWAMQEAARQALAPGSGGAWQKTKDVGGFLLDAGGSMIGLLAAYPTLTGMGIYSGLSGDEAVDTANKELWEQRLRADKNFVRGLETNFKKWTTPEGKKATATLQSALMDLRAANTTRDVYPGGVTDPRWKADVKAKIEAVTDATHALHSLNQENGWAMSRDDVDPNKNKVLKASLGAYLETGDPDAWQQFQRRLLLDKGSLQSEQYNKDLTAGSGRFASAVIGGAVASDFEAVVEILSDVATFGAAKAITLGGKALKAESVAAKFAGASRIARFGEQAAKEFHNLGMVADTLANPASKLGKASNFLVKGAKAGAVNALSEGVEEGISALGDPTTTFASGMEQAAGGALMGLVLSPIMVVPSMAATMSRENYKSEQRVKSLVEAYNKAGAKDPDFKPITRDQAIAAIQLADNPARKVASDKLEAAKIELELANNELDGTQAGLKNIQAQGKDAAVAVPGDQKADTTSRAEALQRWQADNASQEQSAQGRVESAASRYSRALGAYAEAAGEMTNIMGTALEVSQSTQGMSAADRAQVVGLAKVGFGRADLLTGSERSAIAGRKTREGLPYFETTKDGSEILTDAGRAKVQEQFPILGRHLATPESTALFNASKATQPQPTATNGQDVQGQPGPQAAPQAAQPAPANPDAPGGSVQPAAGPAGTAGGTGTATPEAVASYAASDAAIYTAARQANPALPSISDVVTAAKAAGQPVSPSMEQAAAQEAQSQPAQPQEQSAPAEQPAASPAEAPKAQGIADRIKSRVEAAIPGLKGRVNVIEKTSRPSGGAIANDDGTVSLVLSDIEAQLGTFDEQAVEDSVSAMVSEHEVTHVVQYQAVRKAWEDAGGAAVGPFGSFWKEWYGKIHSELSPEAIAAAADIYNGNTAKPWMEMTEKERAASQWGRIPNDANKAAELVRMLVEASRPGADKGRFSELMRALSLKQSPTLIETIRRAVEILVDMVKTGKLPVAVREHVEAISALYDQLLAAESAIPEISDDLADSRAVAMQAVRDAKENLPILKANDDLRIDLETVAWDLAEVMAGMPAEERKAFVDTTIREWLESNAASIEQVTEEAAAAKDAGKPASAREKAKAAREAYQARIRAKAREILNSGDFSVLSAIFDKGAITPKPNAISLILKRRDEGKKLTEKEMKLLRPHSEGGHWDGMPRKQDYPGGGNNTIVRAIIDAIMAPQGKGQMPHEMATAINQKDIGKASEMWEAVYRELESISRGTSMIGEDPDAIETPENIAKAEAERAAMPVTMGNVVDEARAEFGDDHPVTRKAMLFTDYADRLTPEMEDMLIKVMQAEAGRVRALVASPTRWQEMTSGWTDQFKAVHKAIASHTPESLEAWLKGLPVIEEEAPMFSSAPSQNTAPTQVVRMAVPSDFPPVEQGVKPMVKWARENLKGAYPSPALGADVEVTSYGINHTAAQTARNPKRMRVIAALPELIKAARVVAAPSGKNIQMHALLSMDDEIQLARITVEERTGDSRGPWNRFYDIKGVEIKNVLDAMSAFPSITEGSLLAIPGREVTVQQLAEIVNKAEGGITLLSSQPGFDFGAPLDASTKDQAGFNFDIPAGPLAKFQENAQKAMDSAKTDKAKENIAARVAEKEGITDAKPYIKAAIGGQAAFNFGTSAGFGTKGGQMGFDFAGKPVVANEKPVRETQSPLSLTSEKQTAPQETAKAANPPLSKNEESLIEEVDWALERIQKKSSPKFRNLIRRAGEIAQSIKSLKATLDDVEELSGIYKTVYELTGEKYKNLNGGADVSTRYLRVLRERSALQPDTPETRKRKANIRRRLEAVQGKIQPDTTNDSPLVAEERRLIDELRTMGEVAEVSDGPQDLMDLQATDETQAPEIEKRIAEAEASGVVLTDSDKAKIRELDQKAKEHRRKADKLSGAASDPLNKGNAFPMGVGFTRETKRSNQRIDASVRKAGESVIEANRAKSLAASVDSMLSGKGTDADAQRKESATERFERDLVAKLLSWKKGDRFRDYTIDRINIDRDGYPSSFNASGGGIIKGVDDKFDVVREFFGRDKEKFRRMVDEERQKSVDAAAQEAATSPTNSTPEPTEAQKKAGNYKVGRVTIGGMEISIENPAGSVRSGTDKDGETWEVEMKSHYGYIRATKGKDGDHIDIFIQEGTPLDYTGPVFVVNQNKEDGSFDEHKAVMGPDIATEDQAKAEYLSNYSPGWKGAGDIARFESVDAFREWATEKRRIAPAKGESTPVETTPTQAEKPQAATVEEVAAENPSYVAPIPETDTLTPEQAASELAKRGITIEKDSTKTGKTVWRIMGKTFDVKDHLKAMGAKWFAPAKAWSIFSNEDPTQAIADTLAGKQPAAKPTTGGEPSATPAGDDAGTDGKPGEDLRLRQLRDRLDKSADERGTRSDALEAVNASTADLIRRGLQYGMPAEVVEDQIEDIAMITRAYDAKKPMFLLGNGAGTGKTFVLGGAIRELRAAGASNFVYVTMNTDLIAQIKRDLADFGIQDVSFHTYSEMSGKEGVFLPDNAVLIFDEAHNVKNSDSSRGEKAQPMMARAKFTIFASATPFENPVEASYLAGTGVFNEAGGHTEWGKAYGANVRKYKVMTPYGMQERETLYWTGGKLEDGLAARQWFVRQGIMVTRPMRLPMEMVESQFTKRPVTPEYVEIHDRINAAYEDAMSAFRDEDGNILDARNNAMVSMHQTNTIKRVLEAAKVDHAVEEANRILDAGGNVVVFVETKADRFIGRYRASQFYDKSDRLYTYPEIRSLMAEWQIMAGMARMSNEAKPPRPFAEFIVQIARAMHEAGIEYELPSVEDQIVEKLGGTSKVAIYTGSVSNSAASKDKEAFLAGKKRVIVATMAKGGTGLSLHDKIGNRETWQVNLNLPWRATGVDQVSGRVARYGLQSKAHINWLFADNIPFERMLAGRVGRRMRDMGALVKGIDMKAARVLTDEFDFQGSTDVKQREGEVSAPDVQDDIWALAERLEKSRSKASDTSMGFFETPYPIAALMTEVSGARGNLLEPSGGRGNLVRFVKDNPKVTSIKIIEARRDNADYLKGQYGDRVTQGDFLEEADSLGKFDTIHMNPPFERVAGVGAQDVAHVMKAFDLLEDNGRLVAIMGEGAFFRNYQQEREFRQWLDDRGAIVVKLPENAFKNSGTGVRTRMVILDKNGEAGRTDIDLEDMDTDSLQSVADAIPTRDSVQMFSSSPVGGQGFFDFGAESGFNTKSQLGFDFEGQPVAKPEPATPDFRLLPTEDKKAIVQEKTRETAERKAAGIQDFGEKIGGARKDLAGKSEGTKPKRQTTDKPGWHNRYEVAEVVAEIAPNSALERYWMQSASGAGMRKNQDEVGRFVINDKRKTDWKGNPERAVKQTFATRKEAETYIPIVEVSRNHRIRRETVDGKDQWGVWREISDRKRVQVVKQTFDTEREAMEFMVRNAVDIIETKTAWREELIVKPEKPVRKGPDRRDRPATPEMFQEAFGFRGVEFGNWMRQAGDGKERQEVLNHAYDGLLDMAEVLGVPPKALSLNGELGLAFGARGQGLSGAKAHYESDYVVINLTKMSGAGSLAHEWIHALDHYLGRLDGRASSKWVKNNAGHMMLEGGDPSTRMVSHRFSKDSEVRPELRDAFTRLMDTIFNKAVKFVEDSQKAENFVAYSRKELEGFLSRLRAEFIRQPDPRWEKRRKPATEAQLAVFDSIANKFISGEDLDTDWRAIAGGKAKWGNYRWTNDALETMGELYKQITNRTGFDKEGRGTIDQLRSHLKHYQTRIKMLESAAAGDEKTRKVPTEFSMNAKRIDQGSLSDYWNTPHEMLARAFSAYIEDRIGESGGASDFLAYGSDNNLPFYRLFNLKPFPEGTERDAIDKAFDELFRTFKTRETEKGVQLYSSAPQQPDLFAAATAPDAADKLGDVKVGRMNALAAYRTLTAKRNGGKALDAKEEQQLLDAEQALGQKLAFDMEGVKSDAPAVVKKSLTTPPPVFGQNRRDIQDEMMRTGEVDRSGQISLLSSAVTGPNDRPAINTTDGGTLEAPGIVLFSSTAYHGTPHKVKRFSLSKIGTGEGAQAYGWGLYFAEAMKVAEEYQHLNAHRDSAWTVEGQPYDSQNPAHFAARMLSRGYYPGDRQRAIMSLQDSITSTSSDRIREFYKKTQDILNDKLEPQISPPGNIYRVILRPDDSELMDWDAPLNEQPEPVRAAFKELRRKESLEFGDNDSAAYAYEEIASSAFEGGKSPEKASALLLQFGIKGIRYFDGSSRFAPYKNSRFHVHPGTNGKFEVTAIDGGKITNRVVHEADSHGAAMKWLAKQEGTERGTYNYVIFDENDIEITHENGEPVKTQELFSSAVHWPTNLYAYDYRTEARGGDVQHIVRAYNERTGLKEDRKFDTFEEAKAEMDRLDDLASPVLFTSAPENDPFQLALAKMPPIYGEVFRAVEAGMSPEDVAAKFNVTSKAVTNILNEVRIRAVIAAKAQAGTLKPETNADGKFVNGRPDLAEGANPDFVAIDQNRNESGIPDVVSMEENYAEADRRLAANYEGEFARLERMAASGQRPDRIDIALAKQIFRRETLSGGLADPQRRARVALFRVAYREQGTEQGRAFQMRRDEALSPAERNALHFTELLYEPSPQVQERMKGADPETRDAILKKWMDQIDAFKAEMKADGIDIEASLAAWHAHKAAVEKAEQVHAGTKTAMDEAFMKLSPPEKMVIRLIRDKAKLSTVMRQTGMSQEQIMDVKHRFGMAWKQAIIDAGKKFAANSLASSAPEDIYDMVMSDLGWQSDEDFNDLAPDYFEKQDQKRKDAKTRERKRKELAPTPVFTPQQQAAIDAAFTEFKNADPSTWTAWWQETASKLTPMIGQTSFEQFKERVMKPWKDRWQTEMDGIAKASSRISFEVWISKPANTDKAKREKEMFPHPINETTGTWNDTRPYSGQGELFREEINETRGTFDVNDPIVMAEVVNEWARRNGSWINKLTEFYKMAILSGPQTMLVNASGGLYVGYDLTVKRATEAAWNGLMGMFGAGDVRSATFSEFLPMLKQIRAAASLAARNALESWKLQSPVFDSYASAKPIQLDFTGVGPEYAPPATTSAISRFLRNITFRELTAVDEFWKGMFAQMDVAALAHRIAAKEEGLSGKAYTDRVEQLMKRGSLAWQRSISRTKRATFQDEIAYGKWTAEDEKKNPAHKQGMPMTWRQALKKSETESAWTILDAIAAKAMEARKTPFFGPLLHVFALPFIATPKNMIQRGLEVTPLGLVVDLIDGMRSLRRRVMSGQITKEESNRIASELYNNTRFIQLLTNQTMGVMIYLAVESLTGGDDDDEYGRPVITGTLPFSATKKGERDTAQAVMPPQSIRIGETIIPYGRIEPFATALSAMVDLAASARRNEGYNAQVVTDSVVGMKEQFKDKLFLKGLGDILRVIENPERGADRLAAGWITGFIPNILRQPIRETDKTLRDTNPQADDGFITAVGKRIGYSVAPQFAPAKLDVWGNEIPSNRGELIGGSTLADSVFRIFDPFNVRTGGKIRPIDAWIFRYNASQPDSSQRIGIEPLGDEVTITVPGETKPHKIALTAQEHAEAIRRIGQAAQSFLGDDWDWKTATAPDAAQRADLIKDTFTTLKRQETERLKIEKTAAATK